MSTAQTRPLHALLVSAALLLVSVCLLSASTAQAQTIYTVTNTNQSGAGSLRNAIMSANNGSGLPVELASFDATSSGREPVRLTWPTTSETHNARFEVQRTRANAANEAASGRPGNPETTWHSVGP